MRNEPNGFVDLPLDLLIEPEAALLRLATWKVEKLFKVKRLLAVAARPVLEAVARMHSCGAVVVVVVVVVVMVEVVEVVVEVVVVVVVV
jgi:hypothetical protein